MERCCFNCRHYGFIGMPVLCWWCELQKDMEHPDTCDGYNEREQGTTVSASTYTKHWYVIKDGRTISDFDNYEEAKKLADSVNGEIAEGYDN